MRDLIQRKDRNGIPESDPRERAIATFLDLGGRLRSGAQRERNGRERDAAPVSTLPPEAAETLFLTITDEIIPRLMLVHRDPTAAQAPAAAEGAALAPEDHARFLELLMADGVATREFVAGLLRRGVSHDVLFLELLSRAAQRLGELWEADLCDFTDVTLGLCRLHEVLREHSVLHDEPGLWPGGDAPRVLLTTACSDQHIFGVVLVAEYFRRAGWRVRSEPGTPRGALAGLLSREPFDLLGISAACSTVVEDIASEIASFRKASSNQGLRVLVGGRLFLEKPDLVEYVGADGVAEDARGAPTAGDELLARSGLRRG